MYFFIFHCLLCTVYLQRVVAKKKNKRKEVEINNIKVEILSACESAKNVEQSFTFLQQETAETKNLTTAAWASFYRYRQELTSRSCFPQHRLRSFKMVITPTPSYASGTWTISKNMKE